MQELDIMEIRTKSFLKKINMREIFETEDKLKTGFISIISFQIAIDFFNITIFNCLRIN